MVGKTEIRRYSKKKMTGKYKGQKVVEHHNLSNAGERYRLQKFKDVLINTLIGWKIITEK